MEFFPLCDSIRNDKTTTKLARRSMYCLFYEPSFLTRTSFERAMLLLGGDVQFTEDASQFFPVRTDSYVQDTIKFLASLHFDLIVMRNSQIGAVDAAAEADVIPVISGGSNVDHPTQALLDVYTLQRELGAVDGLNIGVFGRVDHRNVNALMIALSAFNGVRIILFPSSGQGNPEVLEYCQSAGTTITVESAIEPFAQQLDAIYLNGAQTAAHAQLVAAQNLAAVKIDDTLIQQLSPHCLILDPMQRTGPLMADNTDARWAGYRQAENGLFVRMALLLTMLAE